MVEADDEALEETLDEIVDERRLLLLTTLLGVLELRWVSEASDLFCVLCSLSSSSSSSFCSSSAIVPRVAMTPSTSARTGPGLTISIASMAVTTVPRPAPIHPTNFRRPKRPPPVHAE